MEWHGLIINLQVKCEYVNCSLLAFLKLFKTLFKMGFFRAAQDGWDQKNHPSLKFAAHILQ